MTRRLALCLLFITVPVSAQQRQLRPGFNLFSKAQDVQLGQQAAAQVRQQFPVIKNRELEDYINRIGRKLTAVPESEAGTYRYSFDIVSDKSINAFALPGGPAFVHTGLISAADNDAQIAGVLAHEIAHVALRHGTNQVSKANLVQIPAMLAGALASTKGGLWGMLGELGIGLGANSLLLKFSRTAERDADLLGARIMNKAGYNPIEMARFFEKLEGQAGKGNWVTQFLSDHPNPGNRVKSVEEEIRYLPRTEYSPDGGQLAQMKKVVSGLPAPAKRPAGQPPQQAPQGQGACGNIPMRQFPAPSAQFREFRAREFAFSYPDNWRAASDRSSSSVTITPAEGLVRESGCNAIGFGMIAGIAGRESGQGDLARETDELIRQLQASNPGMRVEGRGRGIRVDGRSALVNTLSSPSPFAGETEVNVLTTAELPQGLFYIVFIAPQGFYKQAEPVFETILRTVRF